MKIFLIVLPIIVLLLGALTVFLILHFRKKGADKKPEETVAKPVAEVAKAEPKKSEPEKAEPAPEVVPAAEPAEAEETEDADEAEEENNEVVLKAVVENGNTRYIVIKYSKSFLAKLIQSDEVTKGYYTQLKNKLLSYKGVKSRVSWKWETFRSGRNTLAKLRLRGKTLSLCLALNPDDYNDTKYIVESIADVKSYVDTPCLYRLKNDRRVKYSGELIDELMRKNGIEANQTAENVDYAAQYPYETTEALLARKLIKELTDEEAQSGTAFKPRASVTAQEVDSIMRDEVAATLIAQSGNTEYKTDKTRQSIVNIDTLSKCFESGERVTLDEIKKRVKDFDKRTTYIKVLARGTLDKALTIEADNFSLQAVKMIVLTGGVAVKK